MTDLDRLKGYQHGAVDYVSIPVVPEMLRAKVKVFAELHRKSQQLEVLNGRILYCRMKSADELPANYMTALGNYLRPSA